MLRLVARWGLFMALACSSVAADTPRVVEQALDQAGQDAPRDIDYDQAISAGRKMIDKSRSVIGQALDQAGQATTPNLPSLDLTHLPNASFDLLKLGQQGADILERSAPADADRYDGTTVLVFVSSSMPITTVRRYMKDTARIGAAVVFRGFKGNTLASMKAWLAQLLDDEAFSEQGAGLQPAVLIDPTLFSRFAIDAAPVILAVEEPLQPCASECPVPPHHRVSGDVGLGWALELIARQGASEGLSERLEQAARILRGQEPS